MALILALIFMLVIMIIRLLSYYQQKEKAYKKCTNYLKKYHKNSGAFVILYPYKIKKNKKINERGGL